MVNPPIIPILSPQCHFAGLLVPAGVVFSCVTKTTWSPAMSSSSGSQGTRLQASIGSCFPCCFRFPIACTLNSYTPYPKIHNTRPNLPTPICVAGYITNSRDVASSNKTPTFSETPSSIYIYIHIRTILPKPGSQCCVMEDGKDNPWNTLMLSSHGLLNKIIQQNNHPNTTNTTHHNPKHYPKPTKKPLVFTVLGTSEGHKSGHQVPTVQVAEFSMEDVQNQNAWQFWKHGLCDYTPEDKHRT